jgi:hypothetical protein
MLIAHPQFGLFDIYDCACLTKQLEFWVHVAGSGAPQTGSSYHDESKHRTDCALHTK